MPVHSCLQPPDTQVSPQVQTAAEEQGLTQTPSVHFCPLWQSEDLRHE